jgi:hypothetical protein
MNKRLLQSQKTNIIKSDTTMKKLFLFLIVTLIFNNNAVRGIATNLLGNPGAESDYAGWTVTNGGSGWSTNGQTPHSGTKCWNSSYSSCTLSQTIDLIAKGYTAEVLDAAPTISTGVYVKTNYRGQ